MISVSLRAEFSFLRDLKSNVHYQIVVFKVGFRLILLPTLLYLNSNFPNSVLSFVISGRLSLLKKKRKYDAMPISCYLLFLSI